MLVDTIFSIVHWSLNTAGFALNSLLIYLVLYKSPKSIKNYSLLILNFALTDLASSLCDLFIQNRTVSNGIFIALISNGCCTKLGYQACEIGYTLSLHFYAHWLWSLVLSFHYRYYILFNSPPSLRKMATIFLIACFPTLIQTYLLCFSYDPPDQIRATLKEIYPNEDFSHKTVTGANDMIKWPNIYVVLHMTLPITPVYVIILILRKRIIDFLESHNEALSKQKKSMHHQLLRALAYQAMIPSFYLIAVIAFSLGMFKIIVHPLVEYTIHVSFLFVPVLSPVSSLIFVRPYRTAIQKLLNQFGFKFTLQHRRSTQWTSISAGERQYYKCNDREASKSDSTT